MVKRRSVRGSGVILRVVILKAIHDCSQRYGEEATIGRIAFLSSNTHPRVKPQVVAMVELGLVERHNGSYTPVYTLTPEGIKVVQTWSELLRLIGMVETPL